MTDNDYREGVLRRLASLEAGQAAIEKRMGAVETKSAIDEVHRKNVETRLGSIEDSLKWLVRLVLGACVAAAMGFALSGGFAP